LLATVAYELAYYRRFRYAFTDDTFDVSWGVFNRRDREIPYDRMQNVDISRTILQRALRLSEVSVETAGGGSTEASITYVTADAATEIQSEIRHRKRAASEDHHDDHQTTTAGPTTTARTTVQHQRLTCLPPTRTPRRTSNHAHRTTNCSSRSHPRNSRSPVSSPSTRVCPVCSLRCSPGPCRSSRR
ncbi:MAG: putative membrane protein, partial [Halonotius sp. J07HN6]